jgi:RND family efflux transporter MFP subunit
MKAYVALALPLSALLVACGQRIEAESSAVKSVEPAAAAPAVRLVSDPGASIVSFKTTLYSEHDAELTARKDGVIRVLTGELGDAVTEGAVLARLEDDRETAALQSAQAAVDLARAERTRASALRVTEMITQGELDAAVYKEKAAEASMRTAQVELGYTRVSTPFRGRITQRFVRIGQMVRVGQPLFRVTAPAPLRATLRLPEQQALALRSGTAVGLRGEDGTNVAGRIIRISPAVDPASGTIEVLVDVAQPRSLRPGSTVTLELGDPALRKASH